MKLPFSYKNQIFKPVLALSFLAHGLVVGGLGGFQASPKFSVQEAPSSMEISMVPEEPIQEEIKIEEVLTLKEEPNADDPILEKKIETAQEIKPKPLQQNASRGAIQEAKPDAIINQPPLYPRIARERGWEGVVILKVHVDTNGLPSRVIIEQSSGHEVLDRSAVNAVEKWQFVPAKLGSIPFAAWVKVPIRFYLEQYNK
jgi:periplasmic protein TonB